MNAIVLVVLLLALAEILCGALSRIYAMAPPKPFQTADVKRRPLPGFAIPTEDRLLYAADPEFARQMGIRMPDILPPAEWLEEAAKGYLNRRNNAWAARGLAGSSYEMEWIRAQRALQMQSIAMAAAQQQIAPQQARMALDPLRMHLLQQITGTKPKGSVQ